MINKKVLILLVLSTLINNCSFDNKTGIWGDSAKEKKRISELEKEQKETRTLTPFSSLHRPALGHPDGLPALGCPVFVLPTPVPPRPRPLDLGRPVVTRLPRPRPPSSCERQGHRRCQRQNKKHKIVKKILLFFAQNSGPVAGNDDGGETGKREAKKKRRK